MGSSQSRRDSITTQDHYYYYGLTEEVFNTNPRHISETQFTPVQRRNEQIKSISENDLHWKRLATERPPEDRKSDVQVKNVIWPSENEINSRRDLKENHETKAEEVNDEIDDTKESIKGPPIKSILKNINGDIKKDHVDSSKGKVNFGFQNSDEEVTYEPFEKIDDYVEDNNMYFVDHTQEDENELYVVHKTNHEQQTSVSANEYEPPSYSVEDNYNKLHAEHDVKPPLYNTLTHPKLNPTVIRDENTKDRLNTGGNTQKLKNNNISYSNQAANIFFDSDEEFEDTKPSSGRVTFKDNVSEISA
ncbi:hypothetical protein WA026_004059 [Henosepilachna vigintioctopunctata]|uniref:Uncharacterized protein n=1 Tax=Henosepilachna vigintioctopunctata TaxID=420089 RepID=A0AAW1UF63_9CUCU